MAAWPELKTFTITKSVPNTILLGEEIGLHDVTLIGVAEAEHVVWHRRISSALATIGVMIIPDPLYDRRVKRAQRRAIRIVAVKDFVNASPR